MGDIRRLAIGAVGRDRRPPEHERNCVVLLHAHPDDEAIFTGGTARALADAGTRVVLITATPGDLGGCRVPLSPSETVGRRRVTELERAAEILGVARLVVLDRRDSGLPGWSANTHPRALCCGGDGPVVQRVSDVLRAERAGALVHYDSGGVYGHPDHVAVHRIGRAAAAAAGVSEYQCTLGREHLEQVGDGSHVVQAAARSTQFSPLGRPGEEIDVCVDLDAAQLTAKRAALAAHASQVGPDVVDSPAFDHAYRYEWFLRAGPETVLDRLAAPAVAQIA